MVQLYILLTPRQFSSHTHIRGSKDGFISHNYKDLAEFMVVEIWAGWYSETVLLTVLKPKNVETNRLFGAFLIGRPGDDKRKHTSCYCQQQQSRSRDSAGLHYQPAQ